MAIGPDGKVTTTGLMDNSAKIPEAPNMSAMKMAKGEPLPQDPTKPVNPFAPKPTGPVLPKDPEIIAKLESLSEEEKQQLDLVLSPSLSQILTKIVPEASDVISQFTSAEENVILPVSVVKNFARKKYPRYRKMWKHIAQHRANDIAWRLNEGKFDLLGRIYAGIGEPVCWALGNFVSDKQISKYNLTHWRRA